MPMCPLVDESRTDKQVKRILVARATGSLGGFVCKGLRRRDGPPVKAPF